MYIRKGYRENGYVFDKELGSGTYGSVWSATNDRGEKVAIKIFLDDSEDPTEEIQALDELTKNKLCDRSICLENVYRQGKLTRLVTDLVEGETMTNYIKSTTLKKRNKDLNPLRLVLALDYIHKNNIAHKDIKSDNIQRRDKDGKFILLDWGLACLKKDCKGNNCRDVINCLGSGTQYTMPPNYSFDFKNYSHSKFNDSLAHDIWSLGVVLLDYYTMPKGVGPINKYYEDNIPMIYKLSKKKINDKIQKVQNPLAKEILPLMLVKTAKERLANWSGVVSKVDKKFCNLLTKDGKFLF